MKRTIASVLAVATAAGTMLIAHAGAASASGAAHQGTYRIELGRTGKCLGYDGNRHPAGHLVALTGCAHAAWWTLGNDGYLRLSGSKLVAVPQAPLPGTAGKFPVRLMALPQNARAWWERGRHGQIISTVGSFVKRTTVALTSFRSGPAALRVCAAVASAGGSRSWQFIR